MGGEEGVAVFVSLPLLDAEQQAICFNVGQLQPDDFADAQARSVGGHQQGTVLRRLRAREQALEFLDAQHARQLRSSRARREVEVHRLPAQGSGGEKLQPTGYLVARTPCQAAVDEQMMEVRVNLLWTQLVWGAPVELRQACDRGDIGVLGLRGQALQLHLVDHLGA